MAGVKGRSGGSRPGSGRKPREPVHVSAASFQTDDPEAWLQALMRDETIDIRDRKDAAKALLVHRSKVAEQAGKKGLARGAADKAAGGRFAPTQAPKLALVK